MDMEEGNDRLMKFAEAVRSLFSGVVGSSYIFDGGRVLDVGERKMRYDGEFHFYTQEYVIGPIGLLGMFGRDIGFECYFDMEGGSQRVMYDRGDGVYEEYRRNGSAVETFNFMKAVGEWFGMIEDDVLGLFGVDVWGEGNGMMISAPHREWNGHRLDIRLGVRYGWEEFVMNVEAYVEWRRRGDRVGVVDNIFGSMGRVGLN
jgi:hypothetical protein